MNSNSNQNEQIEMNNSNEIINGKGTTNGFLSTFHRKRRHTFHVELKVERIVSLPYANGNFFFKIRLLNGGNHIYTCQERFPVQENKVEFNLTDRFSVKMTSRVDNFTLDHCFCRISIKKEGRGGRSYEKIGYYDLDLASVAGSGDESKACLLNGYQQTNTNPANAYLEIRMKLTILEGDQIFRRPDNNNPYIKVEEVPSINKIHEPFKEESLSTINSPAGELYPSLLINSNRGHSRQASKSSMCSNYSTTSVNSSNNSNHQDKNTLRNILCESHHKYNSHSDPNIISKVRPTSDEETNQQSQRRSNNKRRTPFIDKNGDIQRRLNSSRIDAIEIVNCVFNNNAKTVENPNGYLCLMLNEDGTAQVGSSSSCQSLQPSSSLFLST